MLRPKRELINCADTVKKIKTNFDSFSEMLQWSTCLNITFSSLFLIELYDYCLQSVRVKDREPFREFCYFVQFTFSVDAHDQ